MSTGESPFRGDSGTRIERVWEKEFRELVASVQDYAIFLLDADGHIRSWNEGARRIKGYSEDEILGKHFSVFYPAESVVARWPQHELAMAAQAGRFEDEGWRIRKDGSRFWANVVITPLRTDEGRLYGYLKITRDLTERRKIEALQEAERSKNEFLAILAHELRNPLAAIRTAIQILSRSSETDPERRACELADRQVEHMARLLKDLLDLARLNRGGFALSAEPIDFGLAVRETVETLRPTIESRRHDLQVEIPPEPVPILADRGRLEQIVSNLLTNAAKYTDPGGQIRVNLCRGSRGHALLRVQDSGIGIEPAVLPRIFDLFVQADRRLERSAGGMGIGLTIVKRLVELHGGSVEARSEGTGKGSEFRVLLPTIDSLPAARDASLPEAAGPSLRVLVVDDNTDAADALGMLLELQGQDAKVAYDSAKALEISQSFRPEVVFLDLEMPEMDGYELARRMRQAPETKHTHLVAISGWDRLENLQKTIEAGIEHFLTKPAKPSAIENLLRLFGRGGR